MGHELTCWNQLDALNTIAGSIFTSHPVQQHQYMHNVRQVRLLRSNLTPPEQTLS